MDRPIFVFNPSHGPKAIKVRILGYEAIKPIQAIRVEGLGTGKP